MPQATDEVASVQVDAVDVETHLQRVLPCTSRTALRSSVLPTLLQCIASIAAKLRQAQQFAQAGTANAFGDEQLNVDVDCEAIIRAGLALSCPAVATASSEEDPVETPVRPAGAPGRDRRDGPEVYTVAFDPLDGSSIITANWTVGTIVGVWDGATALGQNPAARQVAAVLGVYGPRTTALVALRVPGQPGPAACFEVGIGAATAMRVLRPRVSLAGPPWATRYFAPANLRAAAEDARYMALVGRFVAERYTLRYSGGLVPDVVHALVKGHGVYVSPVTAGSRAKLRRLYELCPVALVVECAGGRAVDPVDGKRVLDRVVEGTDERGGLVCGNGEEVEMVVAMLTGCDASVL
ncbi:hypothetical protein P8C59_005728 [Phyllachora maydis]|uniref:Sedoheptulose-1,7-bisphosphatase n=1 Tax=Phyllachora maydis TaxID=1825666 RepID=A0AAD9I6K3_9PEZI|nr:hypothetical protein P8C59_005728 [Phyllachora maydis]